MTEAIPGWATAIPAVPGVHPTRTPYTLPSLQELLEQGENLIEQFLKRVVLAVAGAFGLDGESAFDQLTAWGSGVNNALTTIVNNVTDALKAIITAINGLWKATGIPDLIAEAQDALAGLTGTVSSNASDIAGILNRAAAGAAALDGFDRNGSDMGSDWDFDLTSGNGHLATNGTYLYWDDIYPNGSRDEIGLWNGATGIESDDDYQKVTIVLGSRPGNDGLGFVGSNDILARMSADKQNYVRCRISGSGGWQVAAFVGGVGTPIGSGTLATPVSSTATIDFYAGDKGSSAPRTFTIIADGTPVATFTESGTDSLYGVGYRGWGVGGRAEGVLFSTSILKPGKVNQWSAQNQ